MYLTPIIYPETIVPEAYRPFLNLNPFTPLIRSYRRIMLDGAAPDWAGLAYFLPFRLSPLSLVTGGLRGPARTSPM